MDHGNSDGRQVAGTPAAPSAVASRPPPPSRAAVARAGGRSEPGEHRNEWVSSAASTSTHTSRKAWRRTRSWVRAGGTYDDTATTPIGHRAAGGCPMTPRWRSRRPGTRPASPGTATSPLSRGQEREDRLTGDLLAAREQRGHEPVTDHHRDDRDGAEQVHLAVAVGRSGARDVKGAGPVPVSCGTSTVGTIRSFPDWSSTCRTAAVVRRRAVPAEGPRTRPLRHGEVG